MDRLSDEELAARFVKERNGHYLNELMGRHYSRVALWCYRITGDPRSAAGLAQDIIEEASRSLASFAGDAKFTTWLFMLTRKRCWILKTPAIQELEGERVLAASEDISSNDAPGGPLLRDLIARTLDETEIRVMTLAYAENWSVDSITRTLGLTNADGARAHISSAWGRLASAVDRWRARAAVGWR